MDSKAIFVIIATLLVIGLSFVLSMKISGKGKRGTSDWNIGGRNLPIYVIIGTQFASAMGGGVIVGQVGNAYTNGIAMILYGLFASLPFIVFMFIAKWIRTQEFETIPDMLGVLSDRNKAVRIVASVLTIIVPFGWLISQLVAFAKIYREITGLSLNFLIIVMAILSLLFVMPAGMKTVAWTDFFFACLMGIVCVLIVAYALSTGATVSNIGSSLPAKIIDFPGGLTSVGWGTIATWFVACLPGGMTNQMYFQRVCALDDVKKVNKSLIISAIALFLAFSWSCYMGCSIRYMNSGLNGEDATGWLLTVMPLALVALFAALITSTIMSTVSSAVQSVVVNCTHDIYKTVNPGVSDDKLLKMSRVLSVVVLCAAVILGIVTPEVLNWIVNTYAYSAAGLCVPMYIGYALRKKNLVTPAGIIASMICGIAGCIIAQMIHTTIPYVIWGILISFIALLVASAVTKNHYNKQHIEN